MTNTDKTFYIKKIGIFDSGIGGFSVLAELFKAIPEAIFYYVSDDAFAPYGPKTDDFITERTIVITNELLKQGVELIVVACNTATAASIDKLRENFKTLPFVGVEPYLNAYYKMPEGQAADEKKMMVLTTESTGKSERFKRLKERLDPKSQIDHYSLKNMARLIEDYYYHPENKAEFEKGFEAELEFLIPKKYSYAILGCTHYPLVREQIEKLLSVVAISPCTHVAQRVADLTRDREAFSEKAGALEIPDYYHFLSTTNNLWIQKKRESLYGPFKGKKHVKD